MREHDTEAEGNANKKDEQVGGNLLEGEDDIFADNDVDPDSEEDSHLEEKVDPGQIDDAVSKLSR